MKESRTIKFPQNSSMMKQEYTGAFRCHKMHQLQVENNGGNCEYSNRLQKYGLLIRVLRGLQTGSMPEDLPVFTKGSPELLTTQYFTALADHLKYILRHKLGEGATNLPIEITITVPAIWTESAVASTLRAVQTAGLPTTSDISVVTEPVSHAYDTSKSTNQCLMFL